jgi:nucleotide-binding universal stress UspA family protein
MHTEALGPPSRRVVVGYDGYAGSDAALERAAELAGVNGRVCVVHAYTPPREWLGRANYQRRLDALDKAKATVGDLLSETGGPLDSVAWAPEIVADDPAKAIAAVAAFHQADEIVVGTGSFGRARALRGSVADDLARLVDCPITVIPERVAARPPAGPAADAAPRSMSLARTLPLREAAAAGLRSMADRSEPEPGRALALHATPALLVRFYGRWWYPHEIAALPMSGGYALDVQPNP